MNFIKEMFQVRILEKTGVVEEIFLNLIEHSLN